VQYRDGASRRLTKIGTGRRRAIALLTGMRWGLVDSVYARPRCAAAVTTVSSSTPSRRTLRTFTAPSARSNSVTWIQLASSVDHQRHYDDLAPGLAQWLRDVIVANSQAPGG